MSNFGKSTFAVSSKLRKKVSLKANRSGIRVNEYVELVLLWALDNLDLKIEICEEPDDDDDKITLYRLHE